MINFQTKIKILDYFSHDITLIDRIINLFNNLP